MTEPTLTFEELLEEQVRTYESIDRLTTNFKKMGKANMTRGATRTRIEQLQKYWTRLQENDRTLKHNATVEDAEAPYFKLKMIIKAEETYMEALTFLYDWKESLEMASAQASATNASNAGASSSGNQTIQAIPPAVHVNVPQQAPVIQLPRIDMPQFSGDFLAWESFRDLYESLVHKNPSISKVQRFHYLKTCVEGEASHLLANLTVTDANYDTAWNALTDRYDNKRLLIMSHLSSLMGIPPATSESATDLRRLRDKTNEVLEALRNLERPVAYWDDIIVFLTLQKLDSVSRKEWELSLGAKREFPTYEELNKFVETRSRALEAIQASTQSHSSNATTQGKSSSSKPGVKVHHTSSGTTTAKSNCPACKRNHSLAFCPDFRRKPLQQRQELASKTQCCYNCLRHGHMSPDCPSEGRCKHCQRKHHSLLHLSKAPNATATTTAKTESTPDQASASPPPAASVSSPQPAVNVHAAHARHAEPSAVLLATARIKLSASDGRTVEVRALLDQGSETSFITESIAQLLRLPRTKANVAISGLGGTLTNTVRSAVNLQLEPCHQSSPKLDCHAYVLQTLTSYAPKHMIQVDHWPHLQGLMLADPTFRADGAIDMLIGADLYAKIVLEGLRRGSHGGPLAQNTIFGWVLSGETSTSPNASTSCHIAVHHSVSNDELNATLQQFWEREELPQPIPLHEDDLRCENHFQSTHRRENGKEYTVRLPFKHEPPIDIGESKHIAVVLLKKLETRLHRNPMHKLMYTEFMEEYKQLGHMEKVEDPDTPTTVTPVYLPHHAVFRESSTTTRLRVVFNASSPTSNGTSLNDHLLAGPKLQAELIDVILRWRTHVIVFVADIEKMYRKIKVHPDDTDSQRILWRSSPDQDPEAFRLLTVTYGTTSAPFLALRVMKQLAVDEQRRYPLASEVLARDFYVDDVLTGASTVSGATELREQLGLLTESGGFLLKKWAASHAEVLDGVPDDHRASGTVHTLQEDESIRVLGLVWSPENDIFKFQVCMPPNSSAPTKRSILSVSAKLFDPLGWITPVVIVAKILMQELWLQQLDWDDPIPLTLQEQWANYCQTLPRLQELSVPRHTGQHDNQLACEIHGFADASTRAYAAVVYLRVTHDFDNVQVTLLLAKSKVAPVKQISVPRLELCAAQLLSRVIKRVQSTMNLEHAPVYAWTDSSVVLAWLKSHASRWQTFVANRVADIQTRLPHAKWRHVPTTDNPADCATRGITADQLKTHPLWWQGPPWLSQHSTTWPENHSIVSPEVHLEQKTSLLVQADQQIDNKLELPESCSSWSRLLRITAYCFRFCKQARTPPHLRSQEPLSGEEIRAARTFWLREAQKTFHEDFVALRQQRPLATRSPLVRLNPIIDGTGVIRVGGRLRHSLLDYEERHPVILPRHHISDLIVRHAHNITLHGGPQLTIRVIRQGYWIFGCRQLVRSHIHRCVPCIRERARVSTQQMGDLPRPRIQPSRPFLHTGVDYAGPYLVRTSKGRGYKAHKAYIAIFICLAVRAVHIELVSDYSATTFIAAFHRFVSRRGIPSDLYSDNGTTFQGADAELKRAFQAVIHDPDIRTRLASDGTTWHFIPPSAPHFGGLWEAGVKSAKHHLRRVVGDHTLTFEELTTFLSLVEASLNSRPLGPLNDDPNDLTALTPGHFLIGCPIATVPEPSILDVNENRLSRWQKVRHMYEHLWQRWSSEYLHTLQSRQKWRQNEPDLQLNELVLLKNDQQPPSKWPLGRITQLHPGLDGKVRVASVKTATTTLKRPIVKICRLLIGAPPPEQQ